MTIIIKFVCCMCILYKHIYYYTNAIMSEYVLRLGGIKWLEDEYNIYYCSEKWFLLPANNSREVIVWTRVIYRFREEYEIFSSVLSLLFLNCHTKPGTYILHLNIYIYIFLSMQSGVFAHHGHSGGVHKSLLFLPWRRRIKLRITDIM